MKLKFEGLCPHCQKRIELVKELPAEIISEICLKRARQIKEKTRAIIPTDQLSDIEAKAEVERLTPLLIAKLDTDKTRDESFVTKEDITGLNKVMLASGKGASDLWQMMNKEPLNWRINKFADLKKWQLDEVTKILNKAIGVE